MRRFKRMLAAAMVLLLALSAAGYTSAENTQAWKADLANLLKPNEIPATTTLTYDPAIPEGAEVQEKRHSVELVSSRGDVLNVEVTFELVNLPLSDSQWQEVKDWLKTVVTSSVQAVQADSESLANAVAQGIAAARQPGQTPQDEMQIWRNGNLMVKSVSASVPYFPTLTLGDSGDATRRLQKRLVELGFLSGGVDGHFGENTRQAVEAAEGYVRLLEQDMIDNRPDPTPTPTPVPTATPEPFAVPLAIEVPHVTPLPTPEPLYAPETAVDGVADPLLQAYLFSDRFVITRGAVDGTDSDAVLRVQRRLLSLGYTTDPADGSLGEGTARSLAIFQYYNDLPRTGAADAATQQALFSADARRPDNAMLSEGASGEAVTRLQRRLRILGFGSIVVDGSYGVSTRAGVENLQTYMQDMGESPVAVVVNGVADPLLLDDFYSAAFPAIPAAMGSGSGGRDVVRLQRRLSLLEYYTGTSDGSYGAGTAEAVTAFQKQHKLARTGSADTATLKVLFSEDAQKMLKPYVLKVSVDDQRVYAYALDDHNEYTVLARTMKCSTGKSGSPTPTGTYQNTTGPGARWHYFKKFDCWAQYAYYIQGDIMFHSVLYGSKEGSVTRSSVNNLGRQASHGCVRLSVEDAKWIYTNCPRNTKVVVY